LVYLATAIYEKHATGKEFSWRDYKAYKIQSLAETVTTGLVLGMASKLKALHKANKARKRVKAVTEVASAVRAAKAMKRAAKLAKSNKKLLQRGTKVNTYKANFSIAMKIVRKEAANQLKPLVIDFAKKELTKVFSDTMRPTIQAHIDEMIKDIKSEETMKKILNIYVLSERQYVSEVNNSTDKIIANLAGKAHYKDFVNESVHKAQLQFTESSGEVLGEYN